MCPLLQNVEKPRYNKFNSELLFAESQYLGYFVSNKKVFKT